MAINAVFTLPIVSAFLIMPVKIMMLKMIPHSVEGLMTGILNSIIIMNSEVIMRLISVVYMVKHPPVYEHGHIEYPGLWSSYMYSLA